MIRCEACRDDAGPFIELLLPTAYLCEDCDALYQHVIGGCRRRTCSTCVAAQPVVRAVAWPR